MSNMMYDKIVDTLYDLPTGSLDKVISAGLQRKALINEILGHNEENNYRTIIPLTKTDAEFRADNHALTWLLTKDMPNIVEWQWTKNLCTDHKKNTLKITRLISKELNSWRYSHPLRDALKYYLGDLSDHDIVCRLGEMFVAGTTGKSVVISTNLFDFLTSSGAYWNLAAYKSCHNFKGESSADYFSGNVAYWLDKITVITYVAADHNLDRKLGRSWALIPDDRTLQLRTYGNFQQHERKIAREAIHAKLSKYYGVSDYLHRVLPENYYCYGSGAGHLSKHLGYVDTHYAWDYSYPSSKYEKEHELPFLEFMDEAICLSCGDWHANQSRGVCEGCSESEYEYYCNHCGDGLLEDDAYYIGCADEHYCYHCRSELFRLCDSCDEYEFREDAVYVEVLDQNLCDTCYKELILICDSCGVEMHKDDSIGVEGEEWCECCVDNYAVKCCECKGYVNSKVANETQDGDFVCGTCVKEYVTCDSCGDLVKEELTLVDEASDAVCAACLEDKYYYCIECKGYSSTTFIGLCKACLTNKQEEESYDLAA